MLELRPKCRSLLLLTATPMQVHPVELWDLLRLLGLSGRWETSRHDFIRYFAEAAGNPSQEIMEYLAGMFRETENSFGEVTEEQVARLLPKLGRPRVPQGLEGPQRQERHPHEAAGRARSGRPRWRSSVGSARSGTGCPATPATCSGSTTDAGFIDTPIATRDVRDVALDMTPSEEAMYDALGDYIDQTYNNASPEKRSAVGFVLTIYQRRLASSFYALQQTLTRRLAKMGGITEEDLSPDETSDEIMDAEDAEALAVNRSTPRNGRRSWTCSRRSPRSGPTPRSVP